jgi:hypothetical protein
MLYLLPWLAIAALPAQGRSFVVDANNGPGTDFLDLPPAIAAAQHGDVFAIRAGTYSPFSVNLGVALLAEPGAIVRPAGGTFANTVVVQGVPAGRAFKMRGLQVQFTDDASSGIVLNSNGGQVHLEDVRVAFVGTRWRGSAIQVQACAQLMLTRCVTDSHCTLANSDCWVNDCQMRGRDEFGFYGATSGLIHVLSTRQLTVAGGVYTGGNGNPSAAGMTLNFGDAYISGNATTTILGGAGGAAAIRAGNGRVTYDPDITLSPTGSVPALESWPAGTATFTPRQLGYLSASAASLGGTVTCQLHAGAGEPFLFGASLVATRQTLYGMPALVDLTSYVGLGYGVMLVPSVSIAIPVPTDPTLRGLAVAFQAGTANPATLELGLSNPAIATVH